MGLTSLDSPEHFHKENALGAKKRNRIEIQLRLQKEKGRNLQIGREKSLNFVKRNDIHLVVQVRMVGMGNNQQFLFVTSNVAFNALLLDGKLRFRLF